MLAIIGTSGQPAIALLPVAGRPLLIRQLQWLRASGFDRVGVEVPAGAIGAEMRAHLHDSPLEWDVVPVLTRSRLSGAELARGAGFGEDAPVLAIPGDVLGGCDLSRIYMAEARCVGRCAHRSRADLEIQLQPPPFDLPRAEGATLVLLRGALVGGPTVVVLADWAVRLTCAEDAIALGAAVLEGRAVGAGLLVHARERSPGVWVARGGHIHADARVTPPVLVGPGALVRGGAQVGPRVFLGARAVVERGARLVEVLVDDHTIVGETLTARDAHVMCHGLRDAAPWGRYLAVHDPLVLTRRSEAPSKELPLGLAALAAALSALGLGLLLN